MYRLVFQDASVAASSQEVTLEQGFNLAIFFFRCLYDELPELYNSSSKEISKLNFNLMLGRYALTEGWNQVACQVTSQVTHIRTEDLFSCLIAFTKFFNAGCNFELEPLITLLEKIKTYPNKYSLESNLWEKIISNSHRRLVFPYAASSTEKEVSVEHGFNIAMLFFEDLLPLITPMIDSLDHWVSYNYTLLDGYEYPAEWNEAVFRVTNIPKLQQKNVNIPIEVLFSSLIEFSKIMHARFDFELDYLLDLLEAIQKNPSKFPLEVKLWEEVIKNSYSTRSLHREFHWDSSLPDTQCPSSEEIDEKRNARDQISHVFSRRSPSIFPTKEIYQKAMPDGGWAWAEVVNGKIVNGGRHEVKWELYNKTYPEGAGKLYKPDKVKPKPMKK
ncbi:MAG TPA: hypothetical protein VGZ69_03790 [Candidatus Rhabdochlamydia sp.]|jgi:hypothetical protein|nr:hypothetical protein [Candidatus Rhabdochlamydia sp.]